MNVLTDISVISLHCARYFVFYCKLLVDMLHPVCWPVFLHLLRFWPLHVWRVLLSSICWHCALYLMAFCWECCGVMFRDCWHNAVYLLTFCSGYDEILPRVCRQISSRLFSSILLFLMHFDKTCCLWHVLWPLTYQHVYLFTGGYICLNITIHLPSVRQPRITCHYLVTYSDVWLFLHLFLVIILIFNFIW